MLVKALQKQAYQLLSGDKVGEMKSRNERERERKREKERERERD